MKNKILTIVLIVLLIIVGTLLLLESVKDGDEQVLDVENKNLEQNKNEGTGVSSGAGTWMDGETGLEIAYPEKWDEYLKIEKKELDEKDIVKLSFVASDQMEQLFFIINVYPVSHNIWQIESEPNNEMMMVSRGNIFSLTQALDMPFEEGTLDFERYVEMTGKMDEIVAGIKVQDEPFARIQKIFESNKDGKYNLNIAYPEFFEMKNSEKVNEEAMKTVDDLKDSFLEQVSDWEDMNLGDENNDMMSGLGINFELVSLEDDILSFRMLVVDYFSSAAHPNSRSLSFNFDLESGDSILLEDVLGENENYLEVLQEKVGVEISKQFEEKELGTWEEVWTEGIEATSESFDNFALRGNEIIFYFDPYEVGPYAAGSFEVRFEVGEIVGQ